MPGRVLSWGCQAQSNNVVILCHWLLHPNEMSKHDVHYDELVCTEKCNRYVLLHFSSESEIMIFYSVKLCLYWLCKGCREPAVFGQVHGHHHSIGFWINVPDDLAGGDVPWHKLVRDRHNVSLVPGQAAVKDGEAMALQWVLEWTPGARQVVAKWHQAIVQEAIRVTLANQLPEWIKKLGYVDGKELSVKQYLTKNIH